MNDGVNSVAIWDRMLKRNGGNRVFSGVLMLVIGWWFLASPLADEQTLEWFIIASGWWTLRIGGILLLLLGLLYFAGVRATLYLDIVIGSVLSLLLIVVSVYLLSQQNLFLMFIYGIFAYSIGRSEFENYHFLKMMPSVSPKRGKRETTQEPAAFSDPPSDRQGDNRLAQSDANDEETLPKEETESIDPGPPEGFLASFAESPQDKDESSR